MKDTWPRPGNDDQSFDQWNNVTLATAHEALFGIPGADNGLYDPPPVGGDDRAALYLQLDLDGHAT
eukprot:CAMPEP_0172456964 /NCGR_PEP_ID=MMETSP1065-20121228/18759_1 /TAXON_ID=265537 /ORGANISM="Amphiprora paludosa, Strain CCMP125" /LENGTH=65 /DNA_ID=CAMNT_0013210331 /DNA_START=1 /DNA_END=194 /DNA_ORIENTATION=-